MTTRNRPWRTAAAAVGAGALVLGGSALPSFAETDSDVTAVEPLVSEPLGSGPEALEALSSDDVTAVAERHGMQPDTLEDLLSKDQAGVAPGGVIYFKDKWDVNEHDHSSSDADAANVPGDPVGGSRPDAPVTVYLDFDGETVEDTLWNAEHGIETIDASPAASADEDFQQRVWELMAEDYAPFNVNVTTERPSDDDLYKTSEDDNTYGSHVVITDSYDLPFSAGSGGVAFLGGMGAQFHSPAWVFTTGVSGVDDPSAATPKAVADAATHEVGHNLGLGHDGIGDESYYSPQDGVWGPIMGAPYQAPLTQWSNGDYAGATNQEDDLSVIADRGAAKSVVKLKTQDGELHTGPYCTTGDPNNPQPSDEFALPNEDGTCNPPGEELEADFQYTDRADHVEDNHGNDNESATALENAEGAFEATGVISQSDDVDVFSLATSGGPATFNVPPAENGANLDVALTLTDAEGNVVAEANPETTREDRNVAAGLGASLSEELEGGLYYLTVDGKGQGDASGSTPEEASGYSEYGSLGYYTVTGEAEPFDADPITITAPEDGSEVDASDLEVTGSATAGADVTITANGEAAGEATAGEDGSWSTTVDELPYGETAIEAQQTVDGIEVPETASVAVTVPVDAPVITKPEDGQTSNSPLPSFAGTGIADATVNIAIDGPGDGDAEAAAVSGEVTVDGEGNWEFAPESDLADGEYTVTATQTINEVTSDSSEAVAFTVKVESGDEDGSDSGSENGNDDGSEDGSDDGDAGGDAGGTEDGDDGGLPDTGSSSLGLLILAAGLVVLGGGAAWNARTRRSVA